MRALSCLAAGFALGFILWSPAYAQSGPAALSDLRVGETVHGTLAESDPALSSRGRFHVYRFEAEAGEGYVADLRSHDFDAYLVLARPVGGITEFLREDDDSGGGTDARLRFRAETSGTYLLVAQALGEHETGSYALGFERLEQPRAAVAQPVQLGLPVEGWLADGDPLMVTELAQDVYHHLYRFEGRAGDAVLITLDSPDFDAYLEFGPYRGGELIVTEEDDDGGEDTSAHLRVQLAESGTYGVRVRAYGSYETGAYTLRMEPWTPKEPVTRAIQAGQEMATWLSADDAVLEDNTYYQRWTYAGRAGETLRIRMRSDDFDTFLAVGRMVNGAFVELAANDDAPDDGTNSLVELSLPEHGEYVIRANALFSNHTGAYSLLVESLR